MKCSKCGKEFGDGTSCQNCGIDRVTGLANYSGYSTPSNSSNKRKASISRSEKLHQEVVKEHKIIKVDSIVCYACGEIIPADSKYCPHCSTSLYVTCPKCGHEYSSQFPACSKCGTNRNQYIENEKREEERRREERIQRQRREKIEKEKYNEWLKTPEGQIEKNLMNQAEEIKAQCKSQCESDRSSNIFVGFIMIVIAIIACFSMMGKGEGDMGMALLVTVVFLGSSFIGVIGVWKLIKGVFSSPDEYVAEYKSKHPRDPVTNYL